LVVCAELGPWDLSSCLWTSWGVSWTLLSMNCLVFAWINLGLYFVDCYLFWAEGCYYCSLHCCGVWEDSPPLCWGLFVYLGYFISFQLIDCFLVIFDSSYLHFFSVSCICLLCYGSRLQLPGIISLSWNYPQHYVNILPYAYIFIALIYEILDWNSSLYYRKMASLV
jgi:hypothetical protein